MTDLITGFSTTHQSVTIISDSTAEGCSPPSEKAVKCPREEEDSFTPCVQKKCAQQPNKLPLLALLFLLFSPLLMFLGMLIGLFGFGCHHDEDEDSGIADSINRLSLRGRIVDSPSEPAEGHAELPENPPAEIPAPAPFVPREIPQLLNPIQRRPL